MRQRVHLITLGVDDVARSAAFYEALGWRRVPKTPDELVVFDLYGAVLGLYPRSAMAAEIGREVPRGSGAVSLAHNTRDEAEVDAVLAAAVAAGATLLRPAKQAHWGGYNGYFEDLDGHVWEVAFNPFSPLGAHDQFQWGGA